MIVEGKIVIEETIVRAIRKIFMEREHCPTNEEIHTLKKNLPFVCSSYRQLAEYIKENVEVYEQGFRRPYTYVTKDCCKMPYFPYLKNYGSTNLFDNGKNRTKHADWYKNHCSNTKPLYTVKYQDGGELYKSMSADDSLENWNCEIEIPLIAYPSTNCTTSKYLCKSTATFPSFFDASHSSVFKYPINWKILPSGPDFRNSYFGTGGCGPATVKCVLSFLNVPESEYNYEMLEDDRNNPIFATSYLLYLKRILTNEIPRVRAFVYGAEYEDDFARSVKKMKQDMIDYGYVYTEMRDNHIRVINDLFLLSDKPGWVRVIYMDNIDGKFRSDTMPVEEFFINASLYRTYRKNYNPWLF